jgi:predicted ATPase
VIDYRPASAVAAKGKARPIPVWEAVAARTPVGAEVREVAATRLVDRQREIALLADGLARLRTERSPQLVTLVGVPGIGKTRLLAELSAIIEAEGQPIIWLAGRSRPYDSAVSFGALAEMVKAEAAIAETDGPDEADDKLRQAAAEVVPRAADWVHRHLTLLVGGARPAGEPVGDDRPEETFAAWRTFFEALAEPQPLVLVFEDVHWADDGLLDFIDYLIEWASEAPLLVICSARPELLERRPGWGGGKPNAVTLSLAPLSDEDTSTLIALLVGRFLVGADRPAELLARAGGNPLYAEQYVQMLADHGAGDELSPPESIQALIAARLDALSPIEKRIVQDAAVVGRVFWPDAIRALSDRADPALASEDSPLPHLEDSLHRLERKQFLRRDRVSAVAGQRQYAFLHILVREVAYGQIPRAARIERHLRAAQWFEDLGRSDEQAEILARHYLAALDLARATNQDTTGIALRGRTALRAAGDRAQKLNRFAAAAGFFRSALGLWPEDARDERADLLFRLAVARFRAQDDGREQALETARAALLGARDHTRAALMEAKLGEVWFLRGDRDQCSQHLARAYELVQEEAASPEKVEVLAARARYQMLASDFDADGAREALQQAGQLRLDEQRAQLLITIGAARWFTGDRGGREDIRQGLDSAVAGNYLLTAKRAYINLGACAEKDGDLREALRLADEAEAIDQRLGIGDDVRWDRATATELLFELGEWKRSAVGAEELVAESERRAPHYMDTWVRLTRARLRLARDEVRGAIEDQAEGLAAARLAKDPQAMFPALAVSACLLSGSGHPEEAEKLLDEILGNDPQRIRDLMAGAFLDLALAADRLGRTVATRQWIAASGDSRWAQAACALLDHDFQQALAILEDMGAVRGLNLARLWAARVFAESGHQAEAEATLRPALEFFDSVAAKRFIREAEALTVSRE